MVNKISYVLVFMLFTCAGFIACTDDDKVKITEFTLTLTEPEDLNVASNVVYLDLLPFYGNDTFDYPIVKNRRVDHNYIPLLWRIKQF